MQNKNVEVQLLRFYFAGDEGIGVARTLLFL